MIDGQGTGSPTFTYTFLADGTLSTIVAATSGGDDKIRVGDKYQITTNEGHVIQFHLVNYSNARLITIRLIYNQGVLPFSVHRVRITESTDHTIQVLDYRSSQVFPKPQDKLLDKYPDAAAAYGLRLLRSAYLGPAIKVQRDSDNATKDIGFSGGNLDTATLLAFAGSQTVTVDTWYDQSSGGNDASQSGTSSQPTIVDAGTLVTVNGKPALDFDGSDDKFSLNHSDLYGQARFDTSPSDDDNSHIMFSQSTGGSGLELGEHQNSTSTSLLTDYGSGGNLYVNRVDSHLVPGTDTRGDVHRVVIEDGASRPTELSLSTKTITQVRGPISKFQPTEVLNSTAR